MQYLPEFGWDALVVCREEGIPEVVEQQPADGTPVVRIPTPIPPWFSYQLGAWIWAKRIPPRVRELIRDLQPDLVYASCPPFPHALTALRIAHEAGLPIVVDFRDAWSLDPHLSGGPLKRAAKWALCRWVYTRPESGLVRKADAIIMNTPSMLREYARVFAGAEQNFHLVPNGFDEADFTERVERPPRERPLLLFCGRITGVTGRSPSPLLRGMQAAIRAGLALDLEILGDNSAELRRSVRRFGLRNHVRARRRVTPGGNSGNARGGRLGGLPGAEPK